MPQSLAQLYLHIVFSTKNRIPFLKEKQVRGRLHAYLAGICKNLDSPALIVDGVEDHVHLLCRHSKNMAVSHFLQELKRDSSKWVKTEFAVLADFIGKQATVRFRSARLMLMRSNNISPIKRSIISGKPSKMNSAGYAGNTVSRSMSDMFGINV